MEQIKFRIDQVGSGIYRIIANDIRKEFRNIADGSCITDIQTLFAEMKEIENKAEDAGYIAVFIVGISDNLK